ncbi:hypothetical protein Hdeb2414_s0015g00449361 [Helianthus debilis subsp. tardiflorus]
MGSLDVKSDQKVSEQEREVANNEGESMVDSPTTSDENDLLELTSEHTSASDSESMIYSPALNEEIASSSSSTSSSDFLLEDPFQQSDLSHGETKNKGTDHTIERPPIQTMERLSSTPPKYKIPSSIFSRKESGIDGWGMPSNESLFSINMGSINLRNQDSISWRSGELDLGFGIEPSPSDKRMMVGMIPELDETSESDGSEKNLEQDEGGRHHRLDQEDQGGKAVVEEPNSHFSAENVGSRSSFAFPILTAETNKSPSANEKSEPQLDTTPHSEPQPESDKQTEPPKADPPATTWTNCFGCCTICS